MNHGMLPSIIQVLNSPVHKPGTSVVHLRSPIRSTYMKWYLPTLGETPVKLWAFYFSSSPFSWQERKGEKKHTSPSYAPTNSLLSGVESWIGVLLKSTLTAAFSVCLQDSTCRYPETWPQTLVSTWPCEPCLGQFGYTHSWIIWLSLSPVIAG